jgi:glycosyltransferase involved in cell wall biosynthesis
VRLLIVTNDFQVGGAERYLNRVAPSLRSQHGIDVEFFLLDRRGSLIDEAERNGLTVRGHHRPTLPPNRPLGALAATRDLARLLRARSYDAVHTYLYLSDVIGSVAAVLARPPRLIVSRRAVAPRHPPGPLFRSLETLSNVVANELVANSMAVLRDVEATEWALPARRTVIYNGVDPDAHGLATPRPGRPMRLVSVGTLARRKGQRTAIDALRSAIDAGVDAHLTFVGDGPDEGALRQLVSTLGLDDRVRFAGFQADPGPFLREADAFLLPSDQEGFSNSLLEAMAAGLPVIATAVGGNAEALGEGDGGLIVPPSDPAAMARAIEVFAADRAKLPARGLENRDRIKERFTLERSVNDLARWYLTPPSS